MVSGRAQAGVEINFGGYAVSVGPRVSGSCSGYGKSNEWHPKVNKWAESDYGIQKKGLLETK